MRSGLDLKCFVLSCCEQDPLRWYIDHHVYNCCCTVAILPVSKKHQS